MSTNEYRYNARVVDVYDADTITLEIDLGFNINFRKQKFRFFGINAPEVSGVEKQDGIKSRDFLRGLILNKDVLVETVKTKYKRSERKGKYGRFLAVIYLDGVNINEYLIDRGFAEFKNY